MESMSRQLTIINKLGLHARAAAKLVNLAGQYTCGITVNCNGKDANAKSIMSVMMLAATKGTEIEIVTDGDDSAEALDAVCGLVDDRFGESE
jgi:phosphocarrier protein HPr